MSVDGRSTTAIDAPPSSVRVLIAEDDADVRGLLSRGLTSAGHVVVDRKCHDHHACDLIADRHGIVKIPERCAKRVPALS